MSEIEKKAGGKEENEESAVRSSFDRAREAMAKVLASYQELERTGGDRTGVNLYEFPPMMRLVKEMERENLESALRGEELKRIEDTAEFKALAQSAASAKAVQPSHIYGVRLLVLEDMERAGKDVGQLKQELLRDMKAHPDA